MVHIPAEHSPSTCHDYWDHLGSYYIAEILLAGQRYRNHQPRELRGTLQMTTCRCEHVSEPLVMSRALLTDTIKQNRYLERAEVVAKINTIIQDLKPVEIEDAYDNGYDQALDQAMKSISKLTAEETLA
jgi:hypothetical protein